ncbi:retrotransposon protein, putative, ty1-copia subclass [Tanacetum coccineum]
MTTTVVNNSLFRTFFEKQKLTGINFLEWYRNLWIVLSVEDKLPFLEQPIPAMPVPAAGQVLPLDVLNTHTAWIKVLKEIAALMLMTMDPDIQKNLEHLGAYDMLKELKTLYAQQANQELLQTVREFHACKQEERQATFCSQTQNPPTPKKDNLAKDAICHQCGEVGHWRRNCLIYLAELMKKKKLSQGHFRGSRKLKPGALSLYVGDSHRASVEAIGEFHLCLPSRLKRIEKLQHDGLLDSTDIKSFEKCVSCMSRKMARKPYSHHVKRAKDLLGLIHTDVCGPFKIMSKQGASYFVTFTDDFSRYSYVYLLKHKHEVFETFKVFQKEVENQLGKTIKSLRSDRRGEYISQEFLDHLKEHGIIAYRTPPYTPQYNGVSKRRNRTLLDMVRFMMSQTTLPKSFWDYALESAARILNMVRTKKDDKTPYEVWHGQVPKFSYLKVLGCEALVKRDTLTKPDKLEPISIKCIFVGYLKETMGYYFYYPSENKVLLLGMLNSLRIVL